MNESDSRMSKSYIKQIIESANQLNNILNPEHDLEDWVDAKITRARNDLADVLGYLKFYPQEIVEDPKPLSPEDKILVVTNLKNKAKAIIAKLK